MCADHGRRDAHAEPESLRARAHAAESVHDLRALLGWDAGPCIVDQEFDPTFGVMQGDADSRIAGRVALNVLDDIADKLAPAVLIGRDGDIVHVDLYRAFGLELLQILKCRAHEPDRASEVPWQRAQAGEAA